MKHLFVIISFICWGCNAQSPTLSLFQVGYGDINGAYYKDIDNQLNPFEGTWKYTNGTTSLTITLQKRLMQEYNDGNNHFFEDIMVGEYQYIENGILKINTLSYLSIPKAPDKYSITGNILFGPNDTHLRTSFTQADINVKTMETGMFFEKVDSGGVEKLKLIFKMTEGPVYLESEGPPVINFALPFGEYILIKQ